MTEILNPLRPPKRFVRDTISRVRTQVLRQPIVRQVLDYDHSAPRLTLRVIGLVFLAAVVLFVAGGVYGWRSRGSNFEAQAAIIRQAFEASERARKEQHEREIAAARLAQAEAAKQRDGIEAEIQARIDTLLAGKAGEAAQIPATLARELYR